MSRSFQVSSLSVLSLLVLALSGVGCGDDDDGGAGSAGTGVSGSGATSGAGATGGTGGNDTDSGVAGSDQDAGGGTGGTGAVSGTGGDGGTGGDSGTGGNIPCATDCNDNVDCTADSCANGLCVHLINAAACADGFSCHPTRGCEQGGACSGPGDCADTDGCTTNEDCDGTLARCTFDALDGDDDGQAPIVCGGDDCNDANADAYPGAIDVCNGEDDDCDSRIDERATCERGNSCVDGECICPEGKFVCSGQCVDRQTSEDHCGRCGTSCSGAETCEAGSCTCAAPAEECGAVFGTCIDTTTSHNNCGSCGERCGNDEFCNAGTCTACGGAGEPCCGSYADTITDDDGCPGLDLICVGDRESPASRCTCPSTYAVCGGNCVDPKTHNGHCGTCGESCSVGLAGIGSETCVDGACTECGQEVGQPCCEVGSLISGPMLSCNAPFLRCSTDTGLCRRGPF